MTFKEKVVKLRKMKGLTQDEFASAVGVSRQAVYKWESGQSYPEVAKLLEMKILFNISIDDLLDENYEVIVPEKKKKRISKQVREKAESEVLESTSDAPVPVSEPTVDDAEKEPLKVFIPAPPQAPMPQAPAPMAEQTSAPAKKVGFFGRLFGRK